MCHCALVSPAIGPPPAHAPTENPKNCCLGAIVVVCPPEDADPDTDAETETESLGAPSDEDSGRGRSAAVRALQARLSNQS